LYFYSLNRYERKKNIPLALKAFAELKKLEPKLDVKIVQAGGYDGKRVKENVDHFNELIQLGEELGISDDLVLLKNVTMSERSQLLRHS